MQKFTTQILTSQDGSRTFKMDSIIGLMISGDKVHLLYIVLANGNQYCIGGFDSENRAKVVMEEIWYAIDAGISYTVSKEVNDDRIES